ncbi:MULTISPECIES: hypothetical protein [Streptomyces]|uniref:hypothetical protein n=1 Tax=Streptomyces TaxID=1883 RepID=UPI001F1B1498|nr:MULTISPECIES: hypothetical protein [unclassified Streptomyces]WSF81402.1 hypothetical protein OG838_23620 [Streptomyces globisporus]
MVEGLPPDGALARRLAGHHWIHRDFMTADIADLLGHLVVDFRNANKAEKAPVQPYPEKVWRPEKPGAAKKRKKKAAREAAEGRAGYRRIVSLATPRYSEMG